MSERESMHYDVVVVGAGPAGLAAAIRLKQLAVERGQEIGVCVIEKGSEVGAHILSGAVMDPRAMVELFPNWKELEAPLNAPVSEDRFFFLTEKSSFKVPNFLLPGCFQNHGNYVISLGNVCRWLGQQAESLGVEIFPGFAAAEVLYNDDGSVKGVATSDMGVGKDGKPTAAFQRGMELHAKYTFFAEGCRGHLGKQLQERFKLRDGVDPQVYGIGLKELWEIKPEKHQLGLVIHTAGWPLGSDTYGGSFLYHMENNLVAIGYVVGLGYTNPYLSPYEEFQRYKTHPTIRAFLEGGKRVAYGARAITAGGLQALPKLVFPGGCLVGDDAGFLNASRIKGSHCAIKSGMLAAESAFEAVTAGRTSDELASYPEAFKQSWLYDELHRARNFKPWMSKGLYTGTMSSANRRRARVPAQLATCWAVPAYSAASNAVSANKKGRVRVSMCTVSSGCSADSAGRRGISQRVAKVGTAASCTPPPPWPAITSSVSCSSPCKRLATCTAYSAPRAVRATPWRVRWNSVTPTKASSAPIWRDTAPCVSASSCAARV